MTVMMLLWLCVASCVSLCASAFVVPYAIHGGEVAMAFGHSGTGRPRLSTRLFNARIDSSDAVKIALEMSKRHGADSKEARVAWDVVEEMDSSDNSNAFTGGVSDEECSTIEDDPACLEYDSKMKQLVQILKEQENKVQTIRTLAGELRAIKLSQPQVSAAATAASSKQSSPQVVAAIKDARDAMEKHGASSKEARVAWSNVEEIAASEMHNSADASWDEIDEEQCLVDAEEACEALEELSRVLEKQ